MQKIYTNYFLYDKIVPIQKILAIQFFGTEGMDLARARITTTKYEIIQVASEFFFELGYSSTSPKLIAAELQMSPGNLTYYFPTKEHLLSEIVKMLIDFQWKLLEEESNRGIDSAGSICIELMTVASACQESEIARDFFTATFQSNLCREHLREDHVERAKRIFAEYCPDWTDEQFVAAELLVMGIQWSTITANDDILPLKTRISGALRQILNIYNVDEETIDFEINKVLNMECRALGKRVLAEFISYVEHTNQQVLEEMLRSNRRTKSV